MKEEKEEALPRKSDNSNTAVDTVTSSACLNDLNPTASLSVALHEDSASISKPQTRDDACASLNQDWKQIIAALDAIKVTAHQKALIKNEATGLFAQLNSLETTILRDSFDALKRLVKKSSQEYRSSHKGVIKRKKRDDYYREGEVLSLGRDHFRVNTFFPICDQLLSKLRMRKTLYDAVTSNFAFLCKLDTISEAEVRVKAMQKNTGFERSISINGNGMTNCCAQRSFSVLKRIKNYLRSRISEERLNSLAILNIEAGLTKSINYDSVIDEFVNRFVHRNKM
ncbi:hypothetical protein ILUMI_22364 [Ignelater luminosus]|uniref:HAT C-terminal dimerisation domain-containing protein n=1 Tax=Ignelater luminosus TaxID=2038154 RepID=A0A8K0CAQ5_IGNLU|nr:hypothetical protein ILUMI_22364 [Ignelater luminosus]